MALQTDVRIELDGPTWLRLSYDFAAIPPEALLRWFLEPDRLTRWWGQEARVDAEVGGDWQVRWPAMEWTLNGQIVDMSETTLVVSWTWEHEPDLPARALIVQTEPIAGGARLRLIHGPYRQGETFPREGEDRSSHRDGWAHFLPQLASAIEAEDQIAAR